MSFRRSIDAATEDTLDLIRACLGQSIPHCRPGAGAGDALDPIRPLIFNRIERLVDRIETEVWQAIADDDDQGTQYESSTQKLKQEIIDDQ